MSSEAVWYYQYGEDRAGPASESEIRELIAEGIITSDTLVWREGMVDWREAGLTDVSPHFKVEEEEYRELPASRAGGYFTSTDDLEKKLRLWFMVLGISLSISVFFGAVGLVGIMSAIVATFFWLLIMYHVWREIPKERRRFKPFVTVILTIVPVLGIFWRFYCFFRGAKLMNEELEARGISEFRVNSLLALIFCIVKAAVDSLDLVISYIVMKAYYAAPEVFSSDPVAGFNNAVPEFYREGGVQMVLSSLNIVYVFIAVFMMKSFVIGIVRLRNN